MERVKNSYNEVIVQTVLDNGLHISVVEKPAFTRSYVTATLNYGSFHLAKASVGMFPAGIAHFLEHNMFMAEDGDYASKFQAYGASVNAYTSFDKTTYLFRTIDHVEEATLLLLDMVQALEIDEANVTKEIGIITEEIGMYDDIPDSVIFWETMKNLFPNHSLGIDIAGSVDSIQEINLSLLQDCHSLYYQPANTYVVIAGPVDASAMISLIEKHQQQKQLPKIPIPTQPSYSSEIQTPYHVIRHLEAQDKLLIGYKQPTSWITDVIRQKLAMNIYLECQFGPSSVIYERLIDEGIINDSFSAFAMIDSAYAMVMMGGDTKNPERLVDELQAVLKEDVDPDEVERIKRRILGTFLRSLHSLESMAHELSTYQILGSNVFDAVDVLKTITIDEVNTMRHFFDSQQQTMTMLHSKGH
jgi:predicted Zn-dependent peptidase